MNTRDQTLIDQIDAYLTYMRLAGKPVTAVRVTHAQRDALRRVAEWSAVVTTTHYRGLPIRLHGENDANGNAATEGTGKHCSGTTGA